MSAKKKLRSMINRANAQHSSGPRTPEGKQRSSMNAFKHNLTGQSLILQENEMEAYTRLTEALRKELQPKTEMERQTLQKIIDTNFRLNRIAGIENNMFNFGLVANETQNPGDDRLEAMKAQTLAWIERPNSFELLGRYEARLTRQLLAFTREFERLQSDRRDRERTQSLINPEQNKTHNPEIGSFGKTGPQLVMSAQSHTAGMPPETQNPDFRAQPDCLASPDVSKMAKGSRI
jgi:hypothetical protein